ncbi:Leucine-rich repeat-containing protein 56 [Fasciola gigantica]|uniref:Leucine-rich repeat-containing protein 56 n=1 Tax=Fasciola gigantica TaxID=46835 RepID=A0A504YMM6_FASGI|nr:Leucine-rich repeat-containing protein 56 [Fasciola gigantica]
MASIATEASGSSRRRHGITFSLSDMPSNKAHVRVTELSDATINPTPRRPESHNELFDEYIGEQKLKDLTGKDDLSSVKFLEITINVDFMSCGNFGTFLPNLRELRLVKSNVPAVRDLGVSLESLEILWMPRCCLRCLDGLSSMGNLVELYLSFNGISDISPVAMLEQLEVLDLEGFASSLL